MPVALSRQNLKSWIGQAIEEFGTNDLLGVPEPWLKIYEALADYILAERNADQELLWMIEDTDDALPDVIYQLQRLKNALVSRALKEDTVGELPSILSWFDGTIVVLAEKTCGRMTRERSLSEPYEAIFWKARDGMYISTVEGKFLHCNEALVKMLNYESLEELLQVDIQDSLYVDKDDRKVMLKHLRKDGFFDHHEFRFYCADGEQKTALESCYLVEVPNGKKYIVGIMVDVTREKEIQEKTTDYVREVEQKGMEAQLALSDRIKRYEALLNVNDHPVLLLDPKGFSLLKANFAFFKRFKFRKKDLPDLNFRDLFKEGDWLAVYEQISSSVQKSHYHVRGLKCQVQNGSPFPADLSMVMYQDDGGPLLFVQVEDRSEEEHLKAVLGESRKNLQQVLDTVAVGVIGFRGDGTLTLVNKHFRELTGYGHRKLKDPSFLNQLFAQDKYRLKFHKYMRRFLAGDHAEDAPITLKAKSGKTLAFHLNTISFRFEGDEKKGFLALLTDVTAQHRLEELLRTKNREPGELEIAFRSLEKDHTRLEADHDLLKQENRFHVNIIGSIAKKLKIPIHVVLGFASLLRKDLANFINESQLEDLAIIEGHIRAVLGMIEKVEEFAMLEAGDLASLKEDHTVRPMLDDLLERLTPDPVPESVQFEVDNQVLSLDLKINTDLNLLETLLRHLVDNAVKFTREGRVSVSGFLEDSDLWLEVSDNGPGIPATDQPQLCEPFFQCGGDRHPGEQSLGLGLAIAKQYAELIGARMEIHSKVKEGTVVRVCVGPTQNL